MVFTAAWNPPQTDKSLIQRAFLHQWNKKFPICEFPWSPEWLWLRAVHLCNIKAVDAVHKRGGGFVLALQPMIREHLEQFKPTFRNWPLGHVELENKNLQGSWQTCILMSLDRGKNGQTGLKFNVQLAKDAFIDKWIGSKSQQAHVHAGITCGTRAWTAVKCLAQIIQRI